MNWKTGKCIQVKGQVRVFFYLLELPIKFSSPQHLLCSLITFQCVYMTFTVLRMKTRGMTMKPKRKTLQCFLLLVFGVTALVICKLCFNILVYFSAMYSLTSMSRTSLGPWKFVLGMGTLSHWRLIIESGSKWCNLDMSVRYKIMVCLIKDDSKKYTQHKFLW